MTSSILRARSFVRCVYFFLTFILVSLCLFLLSILTYITLRKHLMPVSHLVVSVPLGLPPTLRQYDSFDKQKSSNIPPEFLFGRVNITEIDSTQSPLDFFRQSYRVDIHCDVPHSYINRQLGSFFVQLALFSTSNRLIVEHSRLILLPYQSELIRLTKILLTIPFRLFIQFNEKWNFEQTLIERLTVEEDSKRYLQTIELNVYPSSFQIDRCTIHFYVRDLTGLGYSFVHYPLITGSVSTCVLFSVYMTFYLMITGISMLNYSN